jgi:hypothetical protein
MSRSGPDGRRPRAASPGHRTAIRLIALAGLVRVLRSRRIHVGLTSVAIGVVVAGQIAREKQASALARLAAWDKRQAERLGRKAKAKAVHLSAHGR